MNRTLELKTAQPGAGSRRGHHMGHPGRLPGQELTLGGVRVDRLTSAEVIRHVVDSCLHGRGGTIVTPNLDHLALVHQGLFDRRLFDRAELALADGTPLLWASRLKGEPLPERVTGSDLLPALCRAAAAAELTVAFLGGRPGAADRLAADLARELPALRVVSVLCPPMGFEHRSEQFEEVLDQLVDADPAIVFTGLGAPKQELVNDRLRQHLPRSWLIGCGAAIDMHAGLIARAPGWMQRTGTEWVWRLVHEPRRLAHRYLVRDLPYLVRLLAGSARERRRPGRAALAGLPGSSTYRSMPPR